jgi:ribulose-phosphate 3-epimerase
LEKVKQLRKLISERKLNVLIEVDGGVTVENAKALVDAGADVLVAGNTVFSSADPLETIKKLKAFSR